MHTVGAAACCGIGILLFRQRAELVGQTSGPWLFNLWSGLIFYVFGDLFISYPDHFIGFDIREFEVDLVVYYFLAFL